MYAAVSGSSLRMDVKKLGQRGDMMTVGLRAGISGPRSPALEVQSTMDAIVEGYAKAG